MTLNDNPVRRSPTFFFAINQYRHWDDAGVWIHYDMYANAFLNECMILSQNQTTIYVDVCSHFHLITGASAYDICMTSMIQYNRNTPRRRVNAVGEIAPQNTPHDHNRQPHHPHPTTKRAVRATATRNKRPSRYNGTTASNTRA